MTDLPPSLLDAVKDQRAVLFLGSGASRGADHPQRKSIPTGDGLRDMICDKYFGGSLKNRSLMAVSAMAANEVGLTAFQKYIKELFYPFGPASFHELIPTFRWRALVTTNYDLIVERAYETAKDRLQNLVCTLKDGDLYDSRMNEVSNPVGYYKLHGCISAYTDESIPLILSNEQYASYEKNRKRFYGRFQDLGYECPIIFVGYSISDPHIQRILFDLTDPNVKRPMYYLVLPGIDPHEVRYWAAHRVTCVDATFSDFLNSLDRSIPSAARSLPISIGGGQLSIRHHYRVANAAESSALEAFLRTDATHVHVGMNAGAQDAKKFYRGYDEGFGGIIQNLDVKRSLSDSLLLDAILPENETRPPEFHLLTGPAGNGKSITLKRIAWEAAASYEKLVLYANGPAGIRAEPLEEIYQLTGKRIHLFVDHIAIVRDELLSLLKSSASKNLPLTVVGAERDNEWNIYCDQLEPFLTQEFPVRYLSETEARELISLLDRHNALGQLKDYKDEDRLKAFTQRAERQLLVALHEATLGIPFEEIVQDEFERIEPAKARDVYLAICALHQFGAPVRAGLISRAYGVSFEDFRRDLIHPLENVVLVMDAKHSNDVFYKARHQHVASIVFNRVLTKPEDKFDLLIDLISSMNVDYSSDRETFGRIVKGRGVAELFPNIELGRLFYDRVEEVAAAEAFVPHQRAVFEMAHAGGSLVLAEEAARRAYEMNPHSRGIRHTQGEVARRMANQTDDPVKKQALRRITREKIANELSRMNEYDLNTRARLAVDEFRDELEVLSSEADKEKNPSFLAALKDAELAIQRGIQMYPESAEILAVDAQLRDLLEQSDKALRILERAFNLNPRQDWLAVRLARRYEQQRDWGNATRVLERCLKDNPSSKSVHLEYALVLMESAGNEVAILDHLKKSNTAGDNHFEAQFWYARELFLRGYVPESKRMFDSLHANAPGSFRTRGAAPSKDGAGNLALFRGLVERIEEGYAFIRSAEFPDGIFAARSDAEPDTWPKLVRNTEVEYHLQFSRRGPRATDIRKCG